MLIAHLWRMAWRDLGRNRRRTGFTIIAVALGMALLMMTNALIAGVVDDSLQNSIMLRTGHIQLRAPGYRDGELSLRWSALVPDPEARAAQAAALPHVRSATPVLWAGGMLASAGESVGLQVYGIDPAASTYDPLRAALRRGQFLSADARDGLVLGDSLASALRVDVGSALRLTIADSAGVAREAGFVVQGIFATGIPAFDDHAVLLPLATVQRLSDASRRASAIVIHLDDARATGEVAAALDATGVRLQTWEQLNQQVIQTMRSASAFYVLLDAIVILIVASVIVNTLLMSIFERLREIGVLLAIGMRGREVLQLMMLEAALLGAAGVLVGLALGGAGVAYLAIVGISIDRAVAGVAGDAIAISSRMYGRVVPEVFAGLALAMLAITTAAAGYPAWRAARLEPVQALRGR
jgi:ABC-type lipoprotein release transport system permease subunit